MNREDWLHSMVDRLAPVFSEAGHIFPKLAVSTGFPSRGALSNSKRRIGECWGSAAAADGTVNIFISPVIETGLRAADVLVHELCHAVLPPETKHNKTFAALATKMGLEGKPTATTAGEALTIRLSELINDIGAYPHVPLTAMGGVQEAKHPHAQGQLRLRLHLPAGEEVARHGGPVLPRG